MTVISGSGAIVRQFAIPADPITGPSPYVLACSNGGVFVYQPVPRSFAPIDAHRAIVRGRAPILVSDSRGNVKRLLEDVSGSEMVSLAGGGGPRPLGKRTSIAVWNSRIVVGTADPRFLQTFSEDGRQLPALPLSVSPLEPTRATFASAVDNIVGSIHDMTTREAVRRRMLATPMPEHLPSYGGLLIDADSVLWIVLSAQGEPTTRLRALRGDGQVLAEVRIPIRLSVLDIGRDYILGVYGAQDGESHVAMYRLRRAP